MIALQHLAVVVKGTARPQGSVCVKAYTKEGKALLSSTTKGLKQWRKAVADEIRAEMILRDFKHPLVGSVSVNALFVLERPKTVKRVYPCVRPDLDKLLRAILDALVDSGVIGDDGQVCSLQAVKGYGPEPQTHIGIWGNTQ